MRFWITKGGAVPVREQLTAQLKLAMLSEEIKPGARLPSTRELARHLKIHSNTVSAAYRELTSSGWAELRRGSGIYARAPLKRYDGGALGDLDRMISTLLRQARLRGYTLAEIEARFVHWLGIHPPDHLLVVEPDPELRALIVAELREGTGLRVEGAAVEECRGAERLVGAAVVALAARESDLRAALPQIEVFPLHIRSVAEMLAGERRPAPDELITVVSRWPRLLEWAKKILVAAGVDEQALDLRLARGQRWRQGLRAASIIITDAATAPELPPESQPRVYRVIADVSLRALCDHLTL
jgi:DNA-binding transcriptional regulator YhcF (GntR family)